MNAITKVIPGCFVFVNGGDADDGRPHMNYHMKFNMVESSLGCRGQDGAQIVLDVLGDD